MNLYNPYIVIPLLVWMITQVLKFLVAAGQGRIDFRYLYASGGMPSVHSAVVSSLAFTAFLIDGPQSAIFGLSAIFAAIVMYDSFGVRRSTGEQAAAINAILDGLNEGNVPVKHPPHKLREILGHKPLEVMAGAIIGLLFAALFNANQLGGVVDFVTTPVGQMVEYAVLLVSTVFVVAAFVARFYVIRRYRRVPAIVQAIHLGFWAALVFAAIGFGLVFLISQNIAGANWLLWPSLLLIVSLATFALLAYSYGPHVPLQLAELSDKDSKDIWFEGPNKKRRAAKARAKKRR